MFLVRDIAKNIDLRLRTALAKAWAVLQRQYFSLLASQTVSIGLEVC